MKSCVCADFTHVSTAVIEPTRSDYPAGSFCSLDPGKCNHGTVQNLLICVRVCVYLCVCL